MDFVLNEDQQMIQEMARKFAEEKIAPLAEKIDKEHFFPKEIIDELGELGLMGVAIPEEYGGGDMGMV